MGSSQSINKINFEDIQTIIREQKYILINTLDITEQSCLIPYTIAPHEEVETLNNLLKYNKKNTRIIIYGKNSNDEKIYSKYNQLINLGFYNLFLYTGGLFEWLMLQDIYGFDEFPTTKKELDFLKYKSNKKLDVRLLRYNDE
jgi:hypothetical protein